MYHINRYANLHKNFLISNISALLFHVLRIIPPVRASVPCVARCAVYGGAERLCINIHMRVHIYSFGTSSTPRESPVSNGRLPPVFLCAYFRCMVMWLTFSALSCFARLLVFPGMRKSLFRDAEKPVPRCKGAFPDDRKRRSGGAEKPVRHVLDASAVVETHAYAVIIRFPVCRRFCFAVLRCQNHLSIFMRFMPCACIRRAAREVLRKMKKVVYFLFLRVILCR